MEITISVDSTSEEPSSRRGLVGGIVPGLDLTRRWKIPGVGVDTLSECDNMSDRQEWPGIRSDKWPESQS